MDNISKPKDMNLIEFYEVIKQTKIANYKIWEGETFEY